MLTTLGFRDILEIGRQKRPELYNLRAKRPEPVVTRDLRLTARERIAADGSVIKKLEISDIDSAITEFRKRDVGAVAILFLNSYINNTHEKIAASIMKPGLPGVYFSISSDVIPEFREFERLSTTVLNAYLGPVVTTYLEKLLEEFKRNKIKSSLYLCQSEGGITSATGTLDYPVRTLYSGPAAGVLGASAFFGKKYRNFITLDMGGTSTDISLI